MAILVLVISARAVPASRKAQPPRMAALSVRVTSVSPVCVRSLCVSQPRRLVTAVHSPYRRGASLDCDDQRQHDERDYRGEQRSHDADEATAAAACIRRRLW